MVEVVRTTQTLLSVNTGREWNKELIIRVLLML